MNNTSPLLPGSEPHADKGPFVEAAPHVVPASAPVGAETPKEETSAAKVARDIIQTIVMAAIIFLLVQAAFNSFRVDGESMYPNLVDGERLLVSKAVYFHVGLSPGLARFFPFLKHENGVYYLFRAPRSGDIIVLVPPNDPSRRYVKRVIATPGQTVEIIAGKVYVNGVALKEPYMDAYPQQVLPMNRAPVVVPAGQYYVLGDNRNNSSDSRYWGSVPYKNVVGEAWLTYWPVSKIGLAPNYSR